jgi:CheY-like chemotaxis protein
MITATITATAVGAATFPPGSVTPRRSGELPPRRQAAGGPDRATVRPGLILVVDDDPGIRRFVAEALRDEGYLVIEAGDGRAALSAVHEDRPGLILLDMTMPVMDGWQFAAAYRRLPGPHAPIVCVTAAHRAAERAAQIMAEAALPKPFDLDGLLDLVARFVPPPAQPGSGPRGGD